MKTTYRPTKATKSKHRKHWAQCTLSTSLSRDRDTTIVVLISGALARIRLITKVSTPE